MIDREMDEIARFHHDAAWESLRQCYKMFEQKRRARAQDLLLDAKFHACKVPGWYVDNELTANLDKTEKLLLRGFLD